MNMKTKTNKPQAHKVGAQANKEIVINGVKITKPLNEYTPIELGVSGFACMAYNAMEEDTPEIAKLAIADCDALTEYVICEKALSCNQTIRYTADEYMLKACSFCYALAHTNDDIESMVSIKDMKKLIDLMIDGDNVYHDIIIMATVIAQNAEYTNAINVLMTALRVGYKVTSPTKKFKFTQELNVEATIEYRFEIEADSKEEAFDKARKYLDKEAYNDFHPTDEEFDSHEEIGNRKILYVGCADTPNDKDNYKCIACDDDDEIEM